MPNTGFPKSAWTQAADNAISWQEDAQAFAFGRAPGFER
jgi:hypothetical protein